jgi:hypothetical protein
MLALIACLPALALALAPAPATGGAWTYPAGTGQAILTLGDGLGAVMDKYDGATRAVAKETRSEASVYVEYGLDDGLTAVVQGGLENYRVSGPVSDAYHGLDYNGAGLRARLFSSESFVWSAQATGLIPGARVPSRPAQSGNTGFDFDARMLGGYSASIGDWPSFVDASLGYRTRGGGPPGEWHADITLGSHVRNDTMILAQFFNTISQGSGTARFPANRTHVAEASLVYDFNAEWSLQVGLYATLKAVNSNREDGIIVALWRRF